MTPVIPAAAMPQLVQQPHGGTLYAAGKGSNRGGMGAVPSKLRQRCRSGFAKRIAVLERIADGLVWLTVRHRCEWCGAEPTNVDSPLDEFVEQAPAVGSA